MKRKSDKETKSTALVTTDRVMDAVSSPSLRIAPLEAYALPDRHPEKPGPWEREPDKVSWIDDSTGLPCIALRRPDGALAGYVGVGPDNPLFGQDFSVVPAGIGIAVHGGLVYSEPCDGDEPQQSALCHVHDRRPAAFRKGAARAVADLPVDLWWFGFRCAHFYDVVPNQRVMWALQSEIGRTYRMLSYVAQEITNLAAQLHAIGEGRRPPQPVGGRPPIGLAPSSRRG